MNEKWIFFACVINFKYIRYKIQNISIFMCDKNIGDTRKNTFKGWFQVGFHSVIIVRKLDRVIKEGV